MGEQLDLVLSNPRRVSVDGIRDAKCDQIECIGEATQQFDGTWRCLANVAGVLAVVEVHISFL